MPRAPHRCGRCPAEWWGAGMAHCTGCHETFGGAKPFDAHQVRGRCISPARSPLFFESRPGVWSQQQGIVAPGRAGEGGNDQS